MFTPLQAYGENVEPLQFDGTQSSWAEPEIKEAYDLSLTYPTVTNNYNRNAIALTIKTQKPCIYVCHAGLINIEIPLIYNGECIGAITTGQVLCTDMNCYPKDTIECSLNWLVTN